MAFSPEDKEKLVDTFEKLGVVPKMDSVEDLEAWMIGYLKSKEKVPPKSSDQETSAHTQVFMHASPQVSVFSGDSKHHVTFDAWKYEVEGLMSQKIYAPDVLAHAIRKSLRGDAGEIAISLGHDAPISLLIDKLHSIYGTVAPKETLLTQFYTSQQGATESVAAWACRLETLIRKAQQAGEVATTVAQEMLRTKFWTGLHQNLKDASRHKYDTIKNFDKLLVEMRCIEHELSPKYEDTTKPIVKMASSKNDTLLESMDRLTKQVQSLQKDVAELKTACQMIPNKDSQKSNLSEQIQNIQADLSNLKSVYQPRHSATPPTHQYQVKPRTVQYKDIQCWGCGEYGHPKRKCPSNMAPLNRQGPAAGGSL